MKNLIITFCCLFLSISLTASEKKEQSGAKKVPSYARISVTDFGAVPNDRKDDTEAFRKAFQAAAKKTFGQRVPGVKTVIYGSPEVFIPHGRYQISSTVQVPGGISLKGEGSGSLILFTGKSGQDMFHFYASRQYVEDLIFVGGHHQLVFSNANTDKTMLTMRRCQFRLAKGFAVRVVPKGKADHMSSLTLIDNCLFAGNYQCVENNGDLIHLRDCWIELKQPEMIDGPAIVNLSGRLMITNLCGVPCANPPKGPKYLKNARWIDNYGSVRLLYARIGGEGGGIPAIYHYRDCRNPGSPRCGSGTGEIIIENSILNVGQLKRENKGVLRLFGLPSLIRMEGNIGYADRPAIVLDEAFAKKLAASPPGKDRLSACFRYVWKGNAGLTPVIPAVLKPFFTKDSEVLFK